MERFESADLDQAKRNFLFDLGVDDLTIANEEAILATSPVSSLGDFDKEVLYAARFNDLFETYYESFVYFQNMQNLVELKEESTSPLRKKEILKYFNKDEDSKYFHAKNLSFSLDTLKEVLSSERPKLQLECKTVYNEVLSFLEGNANPYFEKMDKEMLEKLEVSYYNVKDLSSQDALNMLEPLLVQHLEQLDNFVILSNNRSLSGNETFASLVQSIQKPLFQSLQSGKKDENLSNTTTQEIESSNKPSNR